MENSPDFDGATYPSGRGLVTVRVMLLWYPPYTLLEIDSLDGGYQGERFGHVLWPRSADVINGADCQGGWLQLSDNNIPEYIDGKL
jgi:hypothetical protein